jgi:hypothetical protein
MTKRDLVKYIERKGQEAREKASQHKKEIIAQAQEQIYEDIGVNAFVKDGKILTSSHYHTLDDVPVSKPMLFGVSSAGAQIAPITQFEDYNKNLASGLNDKALFIYDEEGKKGQHSYSTETGLVSSGISVLATKNRTRQLKEGAEVYKYMKIQQNKWSGNNIRGAIVEKVEGDKVYVSDGWNGCGGAYGEATWNCVRFGYRALTIEQMKNMGRPEKYTFIGYVYLLD